MAMKNKNTWTSAAAMAEIERQQSKSQVIAKAKKEETIIGQDCFQQGKKAKPTLPAIRLKAGTWVAMDSEGCFYSYPTKPEIDIGCWLDKSGLVGYGPIDTVLTGLPKVPQSQWNKHLYRVGRSGELIRVEVE